MRAAYWKAAAVAAVVAAVLAWAGGPTAGQPPAPAAKPGAKWEYKATAVRGGPHTDEALNGFGETGWELIAVHTTPGKNEVVYYFKRPK